MKELKAAKRGEWKSSHGGQAPTEAQLMVSISQVNWRSTVGGGRAGLRISGP